MYWCSSSPFSSSQCVPGTVARISYFDANADPKRVEAAHLPWSLTFAMTDATAVGSVVAQGDSDAIGCRIVVDGVVKAEKITHETSPRIGHAP